MESPGSIAGGFISESGMEIVNAYESKCDRGRGNKVLLMINNDDSFSPNLWHRLAQIHNSWVMLHVVNPSKDPVDIWFLGNSTSYAPDYCNHLKNKR